MTKSIKVPQPADCQTPRTTVVFPLRTQELSSGDVFWGHRSSRQAILDLGSDSDRQRTVAMFDKVLEIKQRLAFLSRLMCQESRPKNLSRVSFNFTPRSRARTPNLAKLHAAALRGMQVSCSFNIRFSRFRLTFRLLTELMSRTPHGVSLGK